LVVLYEFTILPAVFRLFGGDVSSPKRAKSPPSPDADLTDQPDVKDAQHQ
jgi:hypothetical protein